MKISTFWTATLVESLVVTPPTGSLPSRKTDMLHDQDSPILSNKLMKKWMWKGQNESSYHKNDILETVEEIFSSTEVKVEPRSASEILALDVKPSAIGRKLSWLHLD